MRTTTGEVVPCAREVTVAQGEIRLVLTDGRRLAVPLSWYPRLANAMPAHRARFRLTGGGAAIHWPDVDEDLSVAGLLRGNRAPRGSGRSERPPRRRR
jgi:hypothetical protein